MERLQYNISDIHQLSGVLSNNSRDLSISVADFIQDDRLLGTRVQVVHTDFGVLFACVFNASGSMVSSTDDYTVIEPSIAELLLELSKYGFDVVYDPRKSLPGSQLEYLITLESLGYDKIRLLSVYSVQSGVKKFNTYVVGFNVDKNPMWINNGYAPSDKEFTGSLKDGSAINISGISKTRKWSWSWLDYVADISDILKDNA